MWRRRAEHALALAAQLRRTELARGKLSGTPAMLALDPADRVDQQRKMMRQGFPGIHLPLPGTAPARQFDDGARSGYLAQPSDQSIKKQFPIGSLARVAVIAARSQ